MKNKFKFVLLTLVLATGAAKAHHVEDYSCSKDSVVQERDEKYDALYSEFSQLKSQVKDMENQKRWDKVWKRRKYWKIGLAKPKLERTDGSAMAWKTDYSVFLQQGKTKYFHSKPIAGMIKIGLDYGFVDVNYAKLKFKAEGGVGSSESTIPGTSGGSDGFDDIVSEDPSIMSAMGIDLGMHKIDYALHVGPRVSVNPWNHIIVSAYFHLKPTASGIIENENLSYGFGLAMAAGASVSYKALSVGVEGVWSKIKYTQTSFEEVGDDEEAEGLFSTEKFKMKQRGPRFYIAVKF